MAVSEEVAGRFFKKVKIDAPGCWLWLGARTNGYGVMALGYGNKNTKAHILSFRIHHGEVPVGREVCHRCNQKLCVRPDHLYAGTHKENLQQAKKDGLILAGEKHPRAKLTTQEVRQIRLLGHGHLPKGRRAEELAAMFGVTRSTVGRILTGQSYKGA